MNELTLAPAPQSSRSMRRRSKVMTVIVTLLMVLTGLATVGVSPAAAAPNGCTGVADSGSHFNFRAACNDHDNCYAGHWFGTSENGRYYCDSRFYWKMTASCAGSSDYGECLRTAYVYYLGVRYLGSSYFWHYTGPFLA